VPSRSVVPPAGHDWTSSCRSTTPPAKAGKPAPGWLGSERAVGIVPGLPVGMVRPSRTARPWTSSKPWLKAGGRRAAQGRRWRHCHQREIATATIATTSRPSSPRARPLPSSTARRLVSMASGRWPGQMPSGRRQIGAAPLRSAPRPAGGSGPAGLHALIPRWRKLYRLRGAVERENGRLKHEWALLP
jgi:hypothetical protein